MAKTLKTADLSAEDALRYADLAIFDGHVAKIVIEKQADGKFAVTRTLNA